MGAWYSLVKFTRHERLSLGFLGGCKAGEIIWHHPTAALAAWYILRWRGDEVAFVSNHDEQDGRLFFGQTVTSKLIDSFAEVQEDTIARCRFPIAD